MVEASRRYMIRSVRPSAMCGQYFFGLMMQADFTFIGMDDVSDRMDFVIDYDRTDTPVYPVHLVVPPDIERLFDGGRVDIYYDLSFSVMLIAGFVMSRGRESRTKLIGQPVSSDMAFMMLDEAHFFRHRENHPVRRVGL